VACDVQEDRLALAQDMGADVSLHSDQVAEWAGTNLPEGFDLIVDAVGIADLINLAMTMIAFNGKICTYGIAPQTSMNLDWEAAPYNWDLQFLQFPTFTEEAATHDQIVSWIDMGMLDISKVVSHVMPLDELMEALNLLRNREALKVVIDLKA
jgi:threonine dehydrogenase-like Zn-dependent dehydrogenase